MTDALITETLNEITESAMAVANLDTFDSDSYEEGLKVIVEASYANKNLTAQNRASVFAQCKHWLSTRLKLANYISIHQDIVQKPIKAPIFIVGLPRCGSTLLSYLLAQDGKWRSILKWQVQHPTPPAAKDRLKTDPRCLHLIARENEKPNPLRHIHYESWDGPTECNPILAQDFKSTSFETPLASSIYAEWLLKCDATSAYEYHKKFLQVLQCGQPENWLLKLPSHALNIRSLLEVYPDARLIWIHRDPQVALASFMEMAATVQEMFQSKSDLAYIAKYGPRRMSEHVNRLMSIQNERPEVPFCHIFYDELVRDPLLQIRRVYDWLGQELSDEAHFRMENWLADNPPNKFGKHIYALSRFGLTQKDLEPLFREYTRRYLGAETSPI